MTTGRNNSSEYTFAQASHNLNSRRRASSIPQSIKRARTTMYVVLCLLSLASLANPQASRDKKPSSKPAKSTNGSPTTFTLDVDQMYCDESLPYSYHSETDKLQLTIGERQEKPEQRTAWAGVLANEWKKFTDASGQTPSFTPAFQDPQFDPTTAGTWDEPPTDGGVLNDNGNPLLYDPAWDLSASTYDAQRLLVRTLFGPNPFQIACAYPYLKYPDVKPDDPIHTGADGKPTALLTKGAGYALALNAKDAPQYYLINIVRWKDAAAPKATSAGDKPPATMPFFQAAADDWYLLNYSDSQDRLQDVSQWFHKVTPEMVSDTLRIIGSSKVMFLGIHLAPLPVLGKDGIHNPNPNSAPATEQAWFDAVSLKYTFQASAATPTNMADLNTLLSIILGDAKLGGLSPATQQQSNPAPKTVTLSSIPDGLNKLKDVVTAANAALAQEALREQELMKLDQPIDRFLQQFNPETLPSLSLKQSTPRDYGLPEAAQAMAVPSAPIRPDAMATPITPSATTAPIPPTSLLTFRQPNSGLQGAAIGIDANVRNKLIELSDSADKAQSDAKAQAQAATEAKAKAKSATSAKTKAEADNDVKTKAEAQERAENKANALAEAQTKAINDIKQDLDSVSRLQAEINDRAKVFDSKRQVVLSTFQGRYAAGLLTNLKNLPVTLASNWTAKFAATPLSSWDGNAGVYDLTKPATGADGTNRANVKSSKADEKKADAKKAAPNKSGGSKPDSTKSESSKSGSKPSESADSEATKTQSRKTGGGNVVFLASESVTAWSETASANAREAFASNRHSFGPSLSDIDFASPFEPNHDPMQDLGSPKDATTKDTTAKDPAKKPADSNPATQNPGSTSKPPKNSTSTATTICTISLTKGSSTDIPQSAQHQSDCSDQQTKILDEGRAHWDVSVVVPVQGYQDLTFQSASGSGSNTVTAKSITRENAYGVFDFYFVKEDLIRPPYLGIPHIVVGLPFAGKVFNKPYFAVGETINIPKMISKVSFLSKLPVLGNLAEKDLPLFIRPVFGWVDNKVYPTGGAPTYRSLKPQLSIEMSFSTIKNAVQTLSKNSSKNGSGNTSKPTTPSSVPDSN